MASSPLDALMQAQFQQQLMNQQSGPGYLGQLTGLAGLRAGLIVGNSFDHIQERPYRSYKGLSRRAFMQRTRSGLRARKITEVLFWIVAAFTLIGAIMVPVLVKAMTFFWQWALT